MSDLISRQAAIDALHMHLMYRMGTDSNKKRLDDWINSLPSAQETHEERTETHGVCLDVISRQTVYDALDNIKIPRNASWYHYYQQALTAVSKLPSAQPESEERTEESAQNVPKEELISRKAAIDALRAMQTYKLFAGDDLLLIDQAGAQTELMMLPSAEPKIAENGSCMVKSAANDEDRTMDDLISRTQAIDAIVNTVSEIGLHDNSEVARYGATFRQHEIINIIEGMPSAQPERKKGQWIEVDDAYNRIRGRCSACGWEAHMYEDDVVGMWFCPNCGADMRTVTEDNDAV